MGIQSVESFSRAVLYGAITVNAALQGCCMAMITRIIVKNSLTSQADALNENNKQTRSIIAAKSFRRGVIAGSIYTIVFLALEIFSLKRLQLI